MLICRGVVIKLYVVSSVVSPLNKKSIENANDSVLISVGISGGTAILIWSTEKQTTKLPVLVVKAPLLSMAMQIENFVAISVIQSIDLEVRRMNEISYGDHYTLSIKEAASYFNIGIKKMRRLAEENLGVFAVMSGNRYLIIRTKFEDYLNNNSTI